MLAPRSGCLVPGTKDGRFARLFGLYHGLKNYSQRVFYMYTKICYASAVAMHMMLWYGI
jgi:hypothetical protein